MRHIGVFNEGRPSSIAIGLSNDCKWMFNEAKQPRKLVNMDQDSVYMLSHTCYIFRPCSRQSPFNRYKQWVSGRHSSVNYRRARIRPKITSMITQLTQRILTCNIQHPRRVGLPSSSSLDTASDASSGFGSDSDSDNDSE